MPTRRSCRLQAAGGQATRVKKLVEGKAGDATPLERALIDLVRRAHEQPLHLTPADLDPIRSIVGDGAIDYAFVLGSFHFINRIADLLDVDPDGLPKAFERFAPARRVASRIASVAMRWIMDLEVRPYDRTYAQVLAEFRPDLERSLGQPLAEAFAPIRERPKLVEATGLFVQEREEFSSLDPAIRSRIDVVVEESLASTAEDVQGIHPRPQDPVDAFAFVGTRYASRTTPAMIDALRAVGYDDLGILDLAIAIADANNWARLHRLLGIPAALGYLTAPPEAHRDD